MTWLQSTPWLSRFVLCRVSLLLLFKRYLMALSSAELHQQWRVAQKMAGMLCLEAGGPLARRLLLPPYHLPTVGWHS